MFSMRLVVLLCLLPILFAPASAGEVGLLKVLPEDNPLIIRGRVGADDSFVRRVGLMASAPISDIVFRSTDLNLSGGTVQIGRHQVVPSTPKFDLPTKNTPKDFEIKVTGIKFPGTYQGHLYFIPAERGLDSALKIPIKVIAEAVPKLSQRKGSESVKIQLLNCNWCGPRWLQPNAFPSNYPLQFENASLEPFHVDISVAAIGDNTRSSLGNKLEVKSKASAPGSLGTIPVTADPVYTVPLTIQKNVELYPDHYVGDVKLRLPAPDATIRVPLEVNVRSGPILPLLVLLIGIVLGRIIKYMKDKGGPQSDLLLQAYQLEGKIRSTAEQAILQPMLEDAKSMIYDMKFDRAKTELAAIENRWLLLNTLRSIEQTLQPRAGEEGVADIIADSQAARGLIETKQDQSAATLVAQIETKIRGLAAAPASAVGLATAQARKATVLAARTATGPGPSPVPWYGRTLGTLTGVYGTLRAETTLWIIRPLIYLLLLVALLLVGLQQLYLKNAIFGADPLSDYFGLLIWAMSSDVASRTLSSLKTG